MAKMKDDVPVINQETSEIDYDKIFIQGIDDIPKIDDASEDEFEGKSKKEIAEQLKKQQEEIEKLRGQADQASALQAGIQGLQQGLQRPPEFRQNAQPIQQPGESAQDFAKRLNETYYDNPVQSTQQVIQREIQPALQQLLKQNAILGKKFLELDPTRKETYKRYRSEIEHEISKLPPQVIISNPDIYTEIHDKVRAMHFDEIMEQKLDERFKTLEAEKSQKKPPENIPYSETGKRPGGQTGKKKLKVMSLEQGRYMQQQGYDKKDYYEYLERKGILGTKEVR